MAAPQETLGHLLDRAAEDRVLLERLSTDPLGTALAEGVSMSADDLRSWTQLVSATDQELLEVVRTRLQHAQAVDGCGACS